MDSTTQTLIITQSVTFLALVISESMPFLPGPYQGIAQCVLSFLGMIKPPTPVIPPSSTQ